MFDQLARPDNRQWNDLYLLGKPLAKSLPFWNCTIALLTLTILGETLIRHGIRIHLPYMGVASLLLAGLVLVLTWTFIRYVSRTRERVEALPEEQRAKALDDAGNFTRKFWGAVYAATLIFSMLRLFQL